MLPSSSLSATLKLLIVSPLFTSTTPFAGHFDGNGKTISNFKVADKDEDGNNKHVSSSSQYYGLFGYIGSEGKVENVTLNSFEVYVSRATSLSSSKQSNYGLLAGYCAGTVKNVTVTNSTLNVKSTNKTSNLIVVGGLVGNLAGKGTLENVSVDADVAFNGVLDVTLGGVVGSTVNAERMSKVENDATVKIPNIYKASYTGDINVKLEGTTCSVVTAVGGLVGKNYSALVDDCSSTGTITINSEFSKVASQTITLGGLVGWMVSDNAVLSNSKSSVTFDVTTFDVPADEDVLNIYAGLLVGQNGGSAPAKSMIVNCQYEVAEGTNVINVSTSEAVVVTSALVANQVSQLNDCTATATVSVLVKEYAVVSEGESTVEKEYTLTI